MTVEMVFKRFRLIHKNLNLLREKIRKLDDPDCFKLDNNITLSYDDARSIYDNVSELLDIYNKLINTEISVTMPQRCKRAEFGVDDWMVEDVCND